MMVSAFWQVWGIMLGTSVAPLPRSLLNIQDWPLIIQRGDFAAYTVPLTTPEALRTFWGLSHRLWHPLWFWPSWKGGVARHYRLRRIGCVHTGVRLVREGSAPGEKPCPQSRAAPHGPRSGYAV